MKHQPVLLTEVLTALNPQPSQWFIDATLGGGGHTRALLAAQAKVIAFDHDNQAIDYNQNQFAIELKQGRLILIRASFSDLTNQVRQVLTHQEQIQGILFDFGTSSDQLTDPTRGFSFDSDAQLDMRMDDRLGVTAKDLLQVLSTQQLTQVFRDLGGETQAKQIASLIVTKRTAGKPINTTHQLAQLVQSVKQRQGKLHPATQVFQALRILVNDELNNIKSTLPQALNLVASKGKITTISFHEGEDRLVKTAFKKWQQQKLGTMLTLKPITPTAQEILENPKSRSAKMRVFQKEQL